MEGRLSRTPVSAGPAGVEPGQHAAPPPPPPPQPLSPLQSGVPNMGLVIFMQVLATKCTDFGSVCCIGTCELLRIYWQAAR
ncbi:hypothetical protein HaLaN_31556 [Haematococcus lacustris]|uniref:Uncharacterized protein n=1 Tax=Haematococcus lacustris TaxID=44745 RepID=A0A6A0AHA5_HAELA|nr:hypothetical protein HaLaN_31556 [Haematococcus lacustris]